MTMMHRCSGMFLAAAIILCVTTLICIGITAAIMRKHNQYKFRLRLSTTARVEVEAQLALNLEVENFYLILMLDFINTKDTALLMHKAAVLRTVFNTLSVNPTLVQDIQSVMFRPGGTRPILMSILDQAAESLDEDIQLAYGRFVQNTDDLNKLCQETSAEITHMMQDKMGITPQLGYITPQVQDAAQRSVRVLTADKSVQLVYDRETAVALNILEQRAITESQEE